MTESINLTGTLEMYHSRPLRSQTVPNASAAKGLKDNVATAAEPTEDDVKCDNHPQRKARTFTGNGAYEVHLCEDCTPVWFKD